MTGNDIREALKWSVFAAVIVALWCGVIAVRKARAAFPGGPSADVVQEKRYPPTGLRPVWVIVAYEMRNKRLTSITQFVFTSYNACQESAAEVKKKLGLELKPVCYLRWMKEGAGKALGAQM